MKTTERFARGLWLLLFAMAPSIAGASVALVPEWVDAPAHNGELVYDGVHLYSVPSMQSLGVHRELPATHKAAVSADGSRLYLWDEESAFYVYDLPDFTLRHTWPGFAGRRDIATYSVVHPRSPVVIFGGMDWFDTETGVWTQSPESLLIDRNDSLPSVSEDGRWLSFVAARHADGVVFGPLSVFVLDLDDPTRQTLFPSPGDEYHTRIATLVDQGGTRILVGTSQITAYGLPGGTALYPVNLADDVSFVESIIGVNGNPLVSAVGTSAAGAPQGEQRVYRVAVGGIATLLSRFPNAGELGTLRSLGSDLLRVGATFDICFIGCVHIPTTITGLAADGSDPQTLFFDVGTYANASLMVPDSVFGGGGGGGATTHAVPLSTCAGLLALAMALALAGVLGVSGIRRRTF